MLERIPRDHAPLTEQERAVLERVYDEFARTGEPVAGAKVVYDLRGMSYVRSLFGGEALRSYLRPGPQDDWTPRLRAAVRLWREDDLKLVDEYIQFLHHQYHPEQPQLSGAQFSAAFPRSKLEFKRLVHLTSDESFGSLQPFWEKGDIAVYIPERILEWPTLADYLARSITPVRQNRSDAPRAAVQLQEIRIKNFRVLADTSSPPLGTLTVIAGRNETGKSTFLHALRFVSLAAQEGVQTALETFGGLRSVLTRSSVGSLELDLRLRVPSWSDKDARYTLKLGHSPVSFIEEERLSQQGAQGEPRLLMEQTRAEARVLSEGAETPESLFLARDESTLASLHDIQRYRTAIALREGIGTWGFFNFEPSRIRRSRGSLADFDFQARHRLRPHGWVLDEDGANLPQALFELGRIAPKRLQMIAESFRDIIPRVGELHAEIPLDGRSAVLQLSEQGYTDPFTQADLSDGMLRILALLYLAHHPQPPSLICIEEPENGLYPRIIEALLDVFRGLSHTTQVILTTHSVTLLNRLEPAEVLFAERGEAGVRLTRLDSREDVRRFADKFGIGDQVRMGNIEDAS